MIVYQHAKSMQNGVESKIVCTSVVAMVSTHTHTYLYLRTMYVVHVIKAVLKKGHLAHDASSHFSLHYGLFYCCFCLSTSQSV